MAKRIQITESQLRYIVKNKHRLTEQEVQKENLPTIPFSKAFSDNMVKIYDINPNLQAALTSLDSAIQKSGKKGQQLESLSVEVNAGSSPPPATNGLPNGVTQPDHDYNGILSMNVCAVGKKDKCWLPFNRRNERYNIDGGNIYLADSRAENLKHYLEQYLTKKYKAKVTVTIKDVQTSTTKYASAVITGIVFKTPEATTNFYIEDFGQKRGDNFYIGASPSKIWGKNKLNSKNDFSLEKAQQLANNNISDREVIVINRHKAKGTQGELWYGTNQPYIEVKNSSKQTTDPNSKGVVRFWFESYQGWLSEKNNLQKYKQATVEESIDQAKTRGAAGWVGRVPVPPPYKKPTTTFSRSKFN